MTLLIGLQWTCSWAWQCSANGTCCLPEAFNCLYHMA